MGGKIVNRSELAELFGWSLPRVDRAIAKGMPAKKTGTQGQPVQINTAEAVEWLGKQTRALSAMEEARLADLKARTEIRKREHAAKFRDLIPLEDADWMVGDIFATARSRLYLIPNNLVPKLSDETPKAVVLERVRDAVDEALTAAGAAIEEASKDRYALRLAPLLAGDVKPNGKRPPIPSKPAHEGDENYF